MQQNSCFLQDDILVILSDVLEINLKILNKVSCKIMLLNACIILQEVWSTRVKD